MNTESVQLIVSKVEELIRAAGGKVEMFYPYLVKQQLIYGYIWLFMTLSSIIILLFSLFKLSKKSLYSDDGDFKDGRGILYLVLSLIGGLLCFISLCAMVKGISGIFNPNYGAVQELLGMIVK